MYSLFAGRCNKLCVCICLVSQEYYFSGKQAALRSGLPITQQLREETSTSKHRHRRRRTRVTHRVLRTCGQPALCTGWCSELSTGKPRG